MDNDSIIQWKLNKKKQIAEVSFKKRSLSEIIAIVKDDGKDSVNIKKKISEGKKI